MKVSCTHASTNGLLLGLSDALSSSSPWNCGNELSIVAMACISIESINEGPTWGRCSIVWNWLGITNLENHVWLLAAILPGFLLLHRATADAQVTSYFIPWILMPLHPRVIWRQCMLFELTSWGDRWIWLLKTFFRRCCKAQWRRSHLAVTVGDIILSYKTSYTRCMPVGGYGNCELWGPEFCTPRCASGFWGTSYVSGIWNYILNISKSVHLVLLGFVFRRIPCRLTYPLFLFLRSTMTAKVSRKCQRMHSGLFLYLFLVFSTLFSTNEQAFRCTASNASFHHLWLHKW